MSDQLKREGLDQLKREGLEEEGNFWMNPSLRHRSMVVGGALMADSLVVRDEANSGEKEFAVIGDFGGVMGDAGMRRLQVMGESGMRRLQVMGDAGMKRLQSWHVAL